MKINSLNIIKPNITTYAKPRPSFGNRHSMDSFVHSKKHNYSRFFEFTTKNINPKLALELSNLLPKEISCLSLAQKMRAYKGLIEIKNNKEYSKKDFEKVGLDNIIAEIKKSLDKTITPTEVDKKDVIAMFQGFFANSAALEQVILNADFAQYEKDGIPLKYTRKEFISDLNKTLSTLPQDEQNKILNKLGIMPIRTPKNHDIIGYDGIIDLSNLDNNGTEKEVLDLANKFIRQNKVISDDYELNKMLNSLIRGIPEFINIIGKKQHSTHDLSLDVHILTVLKEVIKNPKFQNLSPKDKFCLKFIALLHDIAKKEFVIDTSHEKASADQADCILNKSAINLPTEYKNRIYELIKNHNWLQLYNTGEISADDVAVMFRRKGDYTMAQIFAEADLKGISLDGSFYRAYGSVIKESEEEILKAQQKINSKGQIFLTNSIISPSKLPVVKHKGEEYKVVDFTKLDNSFDLGQYGFEPNSTIDNVRFLIHVGDSFENVIHLADTSKQGFICCSYISLKDKKTFCSYPFGLSIKAENVNIANASYKNQRSGFSKDFSSFKRFLIDQFFRFNIPNEIRIRLNLTPEQYAKLYEEIQGYTSASRFDKLKEFKIDDKTIDAIEVKNAIQRANDTLLKSFSSCNEVNVYSPEVNAILAKVNSLNDVPKEIFKMAKEFDLPIFLLGE